jgi:hypothetical protein
MLPILSLNINIADVLLKSGLLQDLECNYPLHEGEDLRAGKRLPPPNQRVIDLIKWNRTR